VIVSGVDEREAMKRCFATGATFSHRSRLYSGKPSPLFAGASTDSGMLRFGF